MKAMKRTTLLAAALLFLLAAVSTAAAAEKKFSAQLTGGDEVPAVQTRATGKAMVDVEEKGKELRYMVHVKDITGPTMAHIHLAPAGQNGPPVVNLLKKHVKAGKFSGMLARGKITAKDLIGPMKGKTVGDLIKEIEAGNTYVNVHTKAHPDGEIRGQLK